MTEENIRNAIQMAFLAMYPTAKRVEVVGAGTELIVVDVWLQFPLNEAVTWECELDSDDDGNFHFLLADTGVTLLVPYPEG